MFTIGISVTNFIFPVYTRENDHQHKTEFRSISLSLPLRSCDKKMPILFRQFYPLTRKFAQWNLNRPLSSAKEAHPDVINISAPNKLLNLPLYVRPNKVEHARGNCIICAAKKQRSRISLCEKFLLSRAPEYLRDKKKENKERRK